MKILIKIEKEKAQPLLVRLPNRKAIKEVRDFIDKGKCGKAVQYALMKGEFLQTVDVQNFSRVSADLLLTENRAYFDAT